MSYEWKVNGTTVSATQEYTFRGEETGEYALSFTASNEDGTDSVAFTVRVCTEEQMAFDWRFEQTAYNVSVGRTVFIRPYYTENAFDAVYTWKVNGEPVEAPAVETVYAGPAPACILAFTPPSEGTYEVEAVMTNSYVEPSIAVLRKTPIAERLRRPVRPNGTKCMSSRPLRGSSSTNTIRPPTRKRPAHMRTAA